MRKVLLTSTLIAALSFGMSAEVFTSFDFPTEQNEKGKKKKKKKKCCSKGKSCSAKEKEESTETK